MARILRMQMMNKQINFIPSRNFITKSSIESGFLLTENSIISLSYKLDDVLIFCEIRTFQDDEFEPEPCFVLPDQWLTLTFFVELSIAPRRPETRTDQVLIERFTSPYHSAPPPDPA